MPKGILFEVKKATATPLQPEQKTGSRTRIGQMRGFDISIDNHQTVQPRTMIISTALKAYLPDLLPRIHLFRWHRICEWTESKVKGAARKKYMQLFPHVRMSSPPPYI
jgi:hypothetical protein